MSHRPIGTSQRMPPPTVTLSHASHRAYEGARFSVKVAVCAGVYAGMAVGFLAGGDPHILGGTVLGTAIMHGWWTWRYKRATR